MRNKKFDINIVWLLFLGIILFIPFNGSVHLFDWDEINFAESAREMLLTGNYLDVQINYQVFWEKPPLFFWMQVASMKLFGVNEFAARFPNAICGIFTIIVLYLIGKHLKDKKAGLIWSLVYIGSLLPFFYFKSGIIDPWFNLFIFLGIWFMLLYTTGYHPQNKLRAILSAFFIGLAILTKGPVALLIFLLVTGIFLIYKKFHVAVIWLDVFLFILVLGLTGGFWFFLQWAFGHGDMVVDFINYQVRLFTTSDAGHAGFPLYHFVVLFFGVFPASIFAIREYWFRDNGNIQLKHAHLWMLILFLVVLILFSIVKTKIVHYSSLCYFPLTYFASLRLYRLYVKNEKPRLFENGLIKAMMLLFIVFAVGVAALKYLIPTIINSGIIHDKFALANLNAPVQWTGMEFIPALILLITLIFVWVLFAKARNKQAILVLFIGMLSFQYSAMRMILPRVEEITQKTVVDFYKSLPENDVYVEPIGFKSYAHLFYFNKPIPNDSTPKNLNDLLWKPIDKPAYFVSKNTSKENILRDNPQLQVIDEKNGFVFYLRTLENL
jgi:4-amino-4-deoxy-L-arabinose transferase-like glycosyltransferase